MHSMKALYDNGDPKGTRILTTSIYSLPEVDRIWPGVGYNKIPIDPIFYLLMEDYTFLQLSEVADDRDARAWCAVCPAVGISAAHEPHAPF